MHAMPIWSYSTCLPSSCATTQRLWSNRFESYQNGGSIHLGLRIPKGTVAVWNRFGTHPSKDENEKLKPADTSSPIEDGIKVGLGHFCRMALENSSIFNSNNRNFTNLNLSKLQVFHHHHNHLPMKLGVFIDDTRHFWHTSATYSTEGSSHLVAQGGSLPLLGGFGSNLYLHRFLCQSPLDCKKRHPGWRDPGVVVSNVSGWQVAKN